MSFKDFLQEATATANPEKAKAELDKIGKELVQWFKDTFADNFKLINDAGYSITEYSKGKSVFLELRGRIENQGYSTPVMLKHKTGPGTMYATGRHKIHNSADLDEINAVLKKAMADAKKVFKANGVKQNKNLMYPGSSAKAKTRGTGVELDFWIGFDKV